MRLLYQCSAYLRLSNPKSVSPAATCLSSDRVSPLLDNILEDPTRWRLNSHCLCGFAAIRSPAADKCNNAGVYCIYIYITLYYTILCTFVSFITTYITIPWPRILCIWPTETSIGIIISVFFLVVSVSPESGF